MTSDSLEDLKILVRLDRIKDFDSRDVSISVNNINIIDREIPVRIFMDFYYIEERVFPKYIDINMSQLYTADIEDYEVPIIHDKFKSQLGEDDVELDLDMTMGKKELDWKEYLKLNKVWKIK